MAVGPRIPPRVEEDPMQGTRTIYEGLQDHLNNLSLDQEEIRYL